MNVNLINKTSRKPFHLMSKPTSYQCNIACDYCFYLDKEHGTLREQKTQRHMDDKTLEAYIQNYIAASPALEIEFTWQGGEPLMAGLAFYEKALALQSKYGAGRVITNAIQTNGILIDEKFAKFLADNHFLVGISIDGPKELHNAHRFTRSGKGVFDKVIEGLEHLKNAGAEFNIIAVINATTVLHPVEIYNFFINELGARYLQFVPAVEQRANDSISGELAYPQSADANVTLTPWSITGEQYGQFMIAIFKEWVKRDVGRVFVQLFDNALAAWLGEVPALCVMQPTCGYALIVEQNGDVYSCDHYVYPEHRLGNVKKISLGTIVESKAQRAFGSAKSNLPHACMQCEWRFACQGGCPQHRIHKINKHWHNHLCDGYKTIFAYMDPYMKFMADKLRNHQAPADLMSVVSTLMLEHP